TRGGSLGHHTANDQEHKYGHNNFSMRFIERAQPQADTKPAIRQPSVRRRRPAPPTTTKPTPLGRHVPLTSRPNTVAHGSGSRPRRETHWEAAETHWKIFSIAWKTTSR